MNKVLLKDIGAVLKKYRERLGKKQGEVASEAKISTSMLSQIERSMVSPSIDTLYALCEVLGLSVSRLFSLIEDDVKVRVHREGERLINRQNGVSYEQLEVSPDSNYPFEMFLLAVEPGKEIGVSGNGHEGSETGYILEGEGVLVVDEKEYPLCAGDSVSFQASVPHRLKNESTTLLKAVWSAAPPHKDYLSMS